MGVKHDLPAEKNPAKGPTFAGLSPVVLVHQGPSHVIIMAKQHLVNLQHFMSQNVRIQLPLCNLFFQVLAEVTVTSQ